MVLPYEYGKFHPILIEPNEVNFGCHPLAVDTVDMQQKEMEWGLWTNPPQMWLQGVNLWVLGKPVAPPP